MQGRGDRVIGVQCYFTQGVRVGLSDKMTCEQGLKELSEQA